MRHALKLHPEFRSAAVTRIAVDVTRPRRGHLVLRYVVNGRIGDLKIPPVAAPARTDELWKHTCFEAFVRASSDASYYELNFSPSTQWAAYRFSSYRSGMSAANEIVAPHIDVQATGTRCEVEVALELDNVPDLPLNAAWRLNLSAVIEETSGGKSYWALAHPAGKPDFHHSDCFTLELARA